MSKEKRMVDKTKRQGLKVSIKQLEKLLLELKKERWSNIKQFEIPFPTTKKFLISIKNKTPQYCDTWELEQ